MITLYPNSKSEKKQKNIEQMFACLKSSAIISNML